MRVARSSSAADQRLACRRLPDHGDEHQHGDQRPRIPARLKKCGITRGPLGHRAIDRGGQAGLVGWGAGQLLGDRAGDVDGKARGFGKRRVLCRGDLLLGGADLLRQRSRAGAAVRRRRRRQPLGGLPSSSSCAWARASASAPLVGGDAPPRAWASRLGGAVEIAVEPAAPRVDARPTRGSATAHQQVEHEKADASQNSCGTKVGDVELRHRRSCATIAGVELASLRARRAAAAR